MEKRSAKKGRSKNLPAPRLIGISMIAGRLRLTPRRIQQLVGEGLPRVTRGKYDVDQVLDWYIARLERQLAGDSDEDADQVSHRKHELRLLSAKADLQELDLATKRRELVAIADVEKEMTDLVITTKARILAVPGRAAADLVGEQSRVMVQAKLDKSLREALIGLSKA